jgi:hypothetical protein
MGEIPLISDLRSLTSGYILDITLRQVYVLSALPKIGDLQVTLKTRDLTMRD